MNQDKKYKAFISYSRRDKKIVDWFHKHLESYKTPKNLIVKNDTIPKKIGKIFKDVDDLSSHHSLDGALKEALEQSDYLIVFCSTNSANSQFVNEEIKYFRDTHGEENIIPIIINGEPNATTNPDFIDSQESFPKALRVDDNNTPLNPLAIDIRQSKDSRKKALIKVISTMFGIWFDDLWEREKRRTHFNNILIVLLIISILTLIVYAFLSTQNTKKLINKVDTLKTSSKQLDKIEYEISILNVKLSTTSKYKERQVIENKLKYLKRQKKHIKSLLKEFDVHIDKNYVQEAKIIFEEKGATKAIQYLESDQSKEDDENIIRKVINKNNLKAKLYITNLNYKKAQTIYLKNLELSSLELGIMHSNTISIMSELSSNFSDLGEFKKAKDLELKILKLKEKSLGEITKTNIEEAKKIAKKYFDIGEYKKSESLYFKLLKVSSEKLGKQHKDTLSIESNLALCYFSLKEYKKSFDINSKILLIRRKILGKRNLNTLKSMYQIGMDYFKLGQYFKSKKIYLEAYNTSKQFLGKNHPMTKSLISNLVINYFQLKEYNKALSFKTLYKESQVVEKDIFQKITSDLNKAKSLSTYNDFSKYIVKENTLIYSPLEGEVVGKSIYKKKHMILIKDNSGLFLMFNKIDEISPTIKVGKIIKKGYIMGVDNNDFILQIYK